MKGRGQPLARTTEEANPFIAREEFLMNRIVQRNGAAPPWVEVQGGEIVHILLTAVFKGLCLTELDSAIGTFREVLRQSWIRRALRNLSTEHPAAWLRKFTIHDVKTLRDPEWVKREQSYHETALEEVNSLVRKYNGLAPYAVRRPYYIRSVEIEKMYEGSHEDIFRGIDEMTQDVGGLVRDGGSGPHSGPGVAPSGHEAVSGGPSPHSWGLRNLLRRWLDKIAARWNVS